MECFVHIRKFSGIQKTGFFRKNPVFLRNMQKILYNFNGDLVLHPTRAFLPFEYIAGGFMLDWYYMQNAEKFLDNRHFIVWKFPAKSNCYEKQDRPLIYSYSIMTRAYGTYFNDNNMIEYFNQEGFDVYLVDWGNSTLFSLSGWTLDDLADNLECCVIDPLLKKYNVSKLNVFAVCIGGAILSYLIEKKGKKLTEKLHRLAYYGVPIIGARDLGMEKTFAAFYQAMKPFQELLKQNGLSLFFLDMLILFSGSMSMLMWSWWEFVKENRNHSLFKIIQWTFDDRWVPFSAFMALIEHGFIPHESKHDFHIGDGASGIHFLNIVGKDDMLVKPSASIIEWDSPIPERYLSFKQMILNTGHFMFANPGLDKEKNEIARWFAGYSFSSLMYKLKTEKQDRFVTRAAEIVRISLNKAYDRASDIERHILTDRLNALLDTKTQDRGVLSEKLASALISCEDTAFYDKAEQDIGAIMEKSYHREGNY